MALILIPTIVTEIRNISENGIQMERAYSPSVAASMIIFVAAVGLWRFQRWAGNVTAVILCGNLMHLWLTDSHYSLYGALFVAVCLYYLFRPTAAEILRW